MSCGKFLDNFNTSKCNMQICKKMKEQLEGGIYGGTYKYISLLYRLRRSKTDHINLQLDFTVNA